VNSCSYLSPTVFLRLPVRVASHDHSAFFIGERRLQVKISSDLLFCLKFHPTKRFRIIIYEELEEQFWNQQSSSCLY